MSADRNHACDENERSLRVCFISHHYPPGDRGGIGRFTADLARGFAAAGHDVHVVSSQAGAPAVAPQDGVQVHRIHPIVPEALENDAAAIHLSRLAAVYREVLRIDSEKPLDIVSSPIWLAEGLLVALDSHLASVLSLHTSSKTLRDIDAGCRANPYWKPLPILEARCVSAYLHTHANSHAAVKKIAEEYGAPKGTLVIPHGVTDESSRFARARRDTGRVRVLVVGRLEMRKGANVLLDIIPEVLSRFAMVEFVLVGAAVPIAELKHKTLPAALRKQFGAKSKILKRVAFVGLVTDEELYQHYADADILLFPSRYESFGLPVIEAMSFGIPVVAWKAGGVCETVIDGVTGVLVDVGDKRGLVQAVGRLAADSCARREIGAAARARYRSHFSTAVSVPRTIDAYRKIVEISNEQPKAVFQREALACRFASVIESVAALHGEAAIEAARLLIDGDGLDPLTEQVPPRVAVIVTCFNYARYVIEALESVFAQTYRNFDCVVVDDASADNSAEIIANWIADKDDRRFRLVRNECNRGQLASFAVGLAACESEYVAFLDADDFWFPDFLKYHVSVLHGGFPAAATSFSDLVQVDDQGRMLSGTFVGISLGGRSPRDGCLPLYQKDLAEFEIERNVFQYPDARETRFLYPGALFYPWSVTSGMMFRRSVLDAVMPRDLDSLRICADGYIFLLCHYIAGSFAIARPLAAYRRHGKNQFSSMPVLGTPMIAPFDLALHFNVVVARTILQNLLEAPAKLTSILSTRRRQKFVRTLFRRCLLARVPVDNLRVRRAIGWSRFFKDRLRAKVWFLRSRLA
jgi:glycosyltransferase involved in cell wall biosynthesis